jgi:hypothetical protein
MKSARIFLVGLALAAVSCVSGTSAPPSAPANAPSGPGASAGGAACATHKIRSKADLSNCTDACRDQQRDQQRGCSDPACLQGVGAATNACFAKCDEGKKEAKASNCYTE